jgi:hypothetical protein
MAAIVCAGFVLISFGLFARDQFAGASKNQQEEIATGAPRVPGVAPQATRHGQPRRFIDNAAHELESPFVHLVGSSSDWVNQGVPALLGLALYGFGLSFVARYTHGRA